MFTGLNGDISSSGPDACMRLNRGGVNDEELAERTDDGGLKLKLLWLPTLPPSAPHASEDACAWSSCGGLIIPNTEEWAYACLCWTGVIGTCMKGCMPIPTSGGIPNGGSEATPIPELAYIGGDVGGGAPPPTTRLCGDENGGGYGTPSQYTISSSGEVFGAGLSGLCQMLGYVVCSSGLSSSSNGNIRFIGLCCKSLFSAVVCPSVLVVRKRPTSLFPGDDGARSRKEEGVTNVLSPANDSPACA